MEVEAVAAGQDGKGLFEVRPQFIRRTSLAGVIAGDRQPAAEFLPGVLETADIVTLPAVDGNRDAGKLLECIVGVHTQGRIAFFGEAVGLFNLLGSAHRYRFKVISDS